MTVLLPRPSIGELRRFSNTSIVLKSKKSYNKNDTNFENWNEGSVTYSKDNIFSFSETTRLYIAKAERFRNLGKGFDSYNADSPSEIAIDNAISFIKLSDKLGLPLYFVAPGRNGDVLVEFKDKLNKAVEVYFNADNSKEMLFYKGEICCFEGDYNFNSLQFFLSAKN